MEKEFLPYKLALQLKELGFDKPCIAFYNVLEIERTGDVMLHYTSRGKDIKNLLSNSCSDMPKEYKRHLKSEHCINTYTNCSDILIAAPLWQQAFDWFRDEKDLLNHLTTHLNAWGEDGALETFYGYRVMINKDGWKCDVWEQLSIFETYEEARLECLKKLIEIAINRK